MRDALHLQHRHLEARTYGHVQLVSQHVLEDWPALSDVLALVSHELTRHVERDGRDPGQPGAVVKAHEPVPELRTYTHHLPRTRLERLLRRPRRTEQRTSHLVLLRYTLHLPALSWTELDVAAEAWERTLEAVRRNARGTVRTGFARAGVMPPAYLDALPAGERLHLLEQAELGDLERTLAALGLDPVATLGTVELWPFL